MKEYKIAKGWAIFIWVMAPVLIGLFGFLAVMPFIADEIDMTLVLILTPISIGMLTLMVLGLIDVYKGRLIIQEDRLVSIGVFKSKNLKFDERGNTVCDGIITNFQKPNKEGYTQINAKNIAFNVKNIILSWEE